MSAGKQTCRYYKSKAQVSPVYSPGSCSFQMKLAGCDWIYKTPKTLSQGGSTSDKAQTACYTEGPTGTYQMGSASTEASNSTNSTFNNFKSSYQKFSSNISSTQLSTSEINFTETQDITIENNINVTFKGTLDVGTIRGSSIDFTGFEINDKFSFNLKTGDTNLGTRTIQSARQGSATTSDQGTTWASTMGYDSTSKQTADNFTKASNVMAVTFGPQWKPVIILFVAAAIALVVCWLLWCRNRSLCRYSGLPRWACPSIDLFGIRFPNWKTMGKGKRYNYLAEQLENCSTIVNSNNYGSLIKNLKEKLKDETVKEWADSRKFGVKTYKDGKEMLYGIPFTEYESSRY
jgi:hypothetical protein